MKTIIKGDTEEGDAELEITDEGFDNPNFVTLAIIPDEGSEAMANAIDISVEDLYAAVIGFREKRKQAIRERDSASNP